MELVIKALAVIIVLAVVAVLLWSFVAKTQADISTEQTTAAAAAAAANNNNGGFYGYFGYPSTTVYVTDASGNYWRRFYS
jgi:predicted permease